MSPEEIDRLQHADAGPNKSLEQQGVNPVERYVPPDVRRKRKLALERLVCSAPTHEEIYQVMLKEFEMSRPAVESAIRATYARLKEERAQRHPYATLEAENRIRQEIDEARNAGKWTAVANLEKVLASIQGTEAPKEQHIHVEHTVPDSVMQIWGHLAEHDPAKLREMVVDEYKRQDRALPEAPKREVEVVPVSDTDASSDTGREF